MATPLIPVVQKYFAVLYDGTNAQQIMDLIDPTSYDGVIHNVTEVNGRLTFSTGNYGIYRIDTGKYVVFMATRSGYATIFDTNDYGFSPAALAVAYRAITPGTLPS